MNYPFIPGFRPAAPETSRGAAPSRNSAAALREQCVQALSKSPGTADEIAHRMGVSFLSVRPRISELRAQGTVVPTEVRRPNDSGKSAVVWRLKWQQTSLFLLAALCFSGCYHEVRIVPKETPAPREPQPHPACNAHRVVKKPDGSFRIQYYFDIPAWHDMPLKYATASEAFDALFAVDGKDQPVEESPLIWSNHIKIERLPSK